MSAVAKKVIAIMFVCCVIKSTNGKQSWCYENDDNIVKCKQAETPCFTANWKSENGRSKRGCLDIKQLRRLMRGNSDQLATVDEAIKKSDETKTAVCWEDDQLGQEEMPSALRRWPNLAEMTRLCLCVTQHNKPPCNEPHANGDQRLDETNIMKKLTDEEEPLDKQQQPGAGNVLIERTENSVLQASKSTSTVLPLLVGCIVCMLLVPAIVVGVHQGRVQRTRKITKVIEKKHEDEEEEEGELEEDDGESTDNNNVGTVVGNPLPEYIVNADKVSMTSRRVII